MGVKCLIDGRETLWKTNQFVCMCSICHDFVNSIIWKIITVHYLTWFETTWFWGNFIEITLPKKVQGVQLIDMNNRFQLPKVLHTSILRNFSTKRRKPKYSNVSDFPVYYLANIHHCDNVNSSFSFLQLPLVFQCVVKYTD